MSRIIAPATRTFSAQRQAEAILVARAVKMKNPSGSQQKSREVLDTTIVVVALRYIAGGLAATVDDGEWVITSYLAANAIILPITGWLTLRFGRRNYFLFSILVFT